MLPLSDCEPVTDGLLLQPVNTLTALAYVLAGAWLLWRAREAAVPWVVWGYAGVVAAVGVGSVLFHGVGGATASWLHDASVVLAATGVVAVLLVAWRYRRRGAYRLLGAAAVAFAAAAPFQLFGRTGGPLCADGVVPAHGLWHVLTAVSLAAVGMAATRMAR